MNADPAVARRWAANVSALVQLTDTLWTSWYGKIESGPFNTDCLQGHQHALKQGNTAGVKRIRSRCPLLF